MNRSVYLIIILLLLCGPLKSADYENFWGNEKNNFISGFKSDKYHIFNVRDDPDYKNRIIDFFTSMNSGENVDITVIRINGKPEIDYCFFNEKLYSISEKWGEVDTETAQKLVKSIGQNYTGHSTEKKDKNIIYSFKKNKTKILFQQNTSAANTVTVTIFYYSTDLFRMLFNKQ